MSDDTHIYEDGCGDGGGWLTLAPAVCIGTVSALVAVEVVGLCILAAIIEPAT